MKKLFSLLLIISIIAISNCTSIPENNDPILGIWAIGTSTIDSKTAVENTTREEWIFNDVYLGRYQRYSNSKITFYTDFRWSEDDGVYTIIYSDTEINDVTVNLQETNDPEILALDNGVVYAVRE
ncbi:hypothetical protein HME9304_00563 [Flagellimonas maritima]|uniref:Lipocalin-like domain-containing protein n=1 Tax=Flagellimonas maritima TaxID=1383885 RepID=A0A2Z4LP58_9FLAO|nr:hypothetical protein [Allomuricauda aurantiaca]AWX43572.1 hypothetical protein HME9304_00563 [Allomuricauda aurantiaca]